MPATCHPGDDVTLPNFFIAGVVKGGTGALHQYLSQHPGIFMSEVKEPRFFNRDDLPLDFDALDAGAARQLEAYAGLFTAGARHPVRGESTSNYFYSDDALRRIRSAIPDARLLISLRNPVDRAYAHFCMNHKVHRVEDRVLLAGREDPWARRSLYAGHLQNCYRIFGEASVHVVIFEDWAANLDRELRSIYGFLGVDTEFIRDPGLHFRPAIPVWGGLTKFAIVRKAKKLVPRGMLTQLNDLKYRLSPKVGSASAVARREMYSWYREDVHQLERLLGRSLSHWEP